MRKTRKSVVTLLALAAGGFLGLSALASPAEADWRIGIDLRDSARCGPAYEERQHRVWVPPVYRTECQRVWVEPVYRCETVRVWVPDRYEDRIVERRDGCWTRRERVRVLFERGHWSHETRRVQVAAGHWRMEERQVQVSAGHWETRVERIALADRRGPESRLRIEFGGR